MNEFFSCELPEAIRAFWERMDAQQQSECLDLSNAMGKAVDRSNVGIAVTAMLLLAHTLSEKFHKAQTASKGSRAPNAVKHVM